MEQPKNPISRITKAEYAREIGVHERTLCKMLNVEFYKELVKVGYSKRDKTITLAVRQALEKLTVNLNLDEK